MNQPFLLIRLPIVLLIGVVLLGCSPDTPEALAEKPAAVAAAAEAPAAPSQDTSTPSEVPEVIVVVGIDGLIERLQQEGWWGEVNREEQLTVPHLMITRIHPAWRIVAPDLPLPQKKAVFYRLMLPLVMHAN